MAIYILNEGITGLTSDEKEGLNKIKNSIKDLFKKKNNPKPNNKPTVPKENINKKYKFMDSATANKFKNEVLKELSKICRKHRDIVGDDEPYFITDLVFDNETRFYIQILFRDDDEAYNAYLDIISEFENGVKQSAAYRKYADEGYDIDIGFYDDEEGEICLCINNRLYEEYANQKRSRSIDPKLKGYFESANIFSSIELL